jgi:hypothetical protein
MIELNWKTTTTLSDSLDVLCSMLLAWNHPLAILVKLIDLFT